MRDWGLIGFVTVRKQGANGLCGCLFVFCGCLVI